MYDFSVSDPVRLPELLVYIFFVSFSFLSFLFQVTTQWLVRVSIKRAADQQADDWGKGKVRSFLRPPFM